MNRLAGALSAILDEAVADGVAPAVVFALADRGGTLFAGAAGPRGVADARPMSLETPMWLASMTKAVTSLAVMRLVERGVVELDAPAERWLPDIAEPRVLTGFDANGAPLSRPASRPITARHLLSHTSGFGYDFMNADLLRSRGPAGPPPPHDPAWRRGLLLFDPGEGWEYGMSTDWLGALVEAASGERLDAHVTANILEPLAMSRTGFFADLAELASCHVRENGGFAPTPSPAATPRPQGPISGGGGLCGTAPDYLRFLRMILNGGELDGVRVIGQATLAEMTRPQTGPHRAGKLGAVAPHLCLPFDLFPEQATAFGLGFLINSEPVPRRRAAGSFAWAGLANCYYWADPTSDLAGVLLTQLFPFGDARMLALLAELETAAYAASGRG